MKSDHSISLLKYSFEPSDHSLDNKDFDTVPAATAAPVPPHQQESPLEDEKSEAIPMHPAVESVPDLAKPSPVPSPSLKPKTTKKACKNRKFTKEEDDRLRDLVKLYGEGCWTRVAENMPGRNRKQVRERYVNFVKKERSSNEFSPEEDALILSFVQTKGRKWIVISDMLPGRTPIMIKNRYYAKLRHAAKIQPAAAATVAVKTAKEDEVQARKIKIQETASGAIEDL